MINTFYTLMTTICISIITLLTSSTLSYADRIVVMQMKGKAIGETRTIPEIESTGTTEGNCFDVPMVDLETQQRLGTATRCFTDIKSSGDGLGLTETTFLKFSDGEIVSRSRSTVQPTLDSGAEMTHLINAVAPQYVTNLLVEQNTEAYKDLAGSFRYGGPIDLSRFRDHNEIAFDNIGLITFADIKEQVLQVQKRLQEYQFYSGALDGILGPNTKEAIRRYQAKHGLPETGELDAVTRKALDVQ